MEKPVFDEKIISDVLVFVKKCDNEFANYIYEPANAALATKYITILMKLKKTNKSNLVNALIEKLSFITNQIDTYNYSTYKKEAILNLVSVSVTDYIITLVKEKHLVDPTLIARYAYIELSKVLYYDISYVKQENTEEKKIMCDATVDIHKEKIFSYVVCTQWLALYTYILNAFDIKVEKKNIPGQDHVWGEVILNDKNVIVVDATDYIDNSIDLSNAKSTSPTVGFVVLPKEYSGIKLYDVFNDQRNKELADIVKKYYAYNYELDLALGYINKNGYKVETILKNNEIFNYPHKRINSQEDLNKFMDKTIEFFRTLKIPNNMDGYEVFAFYYKFLKELPINIAANVSQKTIYVDSFDYKQKRLKKKFLQAPLEYLKYLDGLVYNMYYKYLNEEESNSIFEFVKKGSLNGEIVRDLILQYEMQIAQINKKLNLYYAINKLQFYDATTCDTLRIQLYEPMMGTKFFDNMEDYQTFKKLSLNQNQ